MKLKKILFCFSLILVSLISFSGCAKVELMRTVDSYSVIMDKLVVTLDKDKLLNNYTAVRSTVIADMVQFRNYVNDWIEGYPKVYLDMKEGIVCEIPESQNNELSIVITFADISFFAVFYGLATINDVEYASAMQDVGPFIAEIFNQEYSLQCNNVGGALVFCVLNAEVLVVAAFLSGVAKHRALVRQHCAQCCEQRLAYALGRNTSGQ